MVDHAGMHERQRVREDSEDGQAGKARYLRGAPPAEIGGVR
jgi:hypothetical protein